MHHDRRDHQGHERARYPVVEPWPEDQDGQRDAGHEGRHDIGIRSDRIESGGRCRDRPALVRAVFDRRARELHSQPAGHRRPMALPSATAHHANRHGRTRDWAAAGRLRMRRRPGDRLASDSGGLLARAPSALDAEGRRGRSPPHRSAAPIAPARCVGRLPGRRRGSRAQARRDPARAGTGHHRRTR